MTSTENKTRTAAYASTVTTWTKGRDKYGRPTRSLQATHRGQWGTVAVIVTMPKAWVESHGDDRYLVSDWRLESGPRPEPVYFRSLAKATAYAEGLVRLLTEDELVVLDAYAVACAAAGDAALNSYASYHAVQFRACWDADDRDQADLHTLLRRIVLAEIDHRTA